MLYFQWRARGFARSRTPIQLRNTNKNAPIKIGAEKRVRISVARGDYLPFFAFGFAALLVVFFETGFLAAAMMILLS
jgi:hypothetical protein